MRYQGRITKWIDDKGYGFVTQNGGGDKAFVHIKAFSTRRRPIEGNLISYEIERDLQNRIRAVNIRYPGDSKPASIRASSQYHEIILVTLFSGVVVALTILERASVLVPLAYITASAITFIAYAFDKSAAMNNRWRTRESRLQVLSLLCGWPGALIAQRMFHHKTRKLEFQRVFWASVAVNCATLIWLVTESGASFIRAIIGTP
jgi:uncharacterized membrane protein YsdA (DUF1294 family)/cold shock CspA family protein